MLYQKKDPLTYTIYDGETMPKGVQAVIIKLKAQPKDTLDFTKEIAKANLLKERGVSILWLLDCFENKVDFENQLDHNARMLAIDEWKKIYPAFEEHTIGISFFRETLDLPFNEAAKYLDRISYHFSLFAHRMEVDIPIFFFFDMKAYSDHETAQLLTPERFSHYVLALKHARGKLGAFTWDEGRLFPSKGEKVGVLVQDQPLELETSFRFLYEDTAHEAWDGLDYIVARAPLSIKARRVMLGFVAAGGTPVYVDKPFGVEGEISLEEFRGRGI